MSLKISTLTLILMSFSITCYSSSDLPNNTQELLILNPSSKVLHKDATKCQSNYCDSLQGIISMDFKVSGLEKEIPIKIDFEFCHATGTLMIVDKIKDDSKWGEHIILNAAQNKDIEIHCTEGTYKHSRIAYTDANNLHGIKLRKFNDIYKPLGHLIVGIRILPTLK